jgi:hypothetical protein
MLLDDLTRASRAGKVLLDPFTYQATFVLPGGALGLQTPVNIPITADSDFTIGKTMLASYTAAGVFLANPDYLCTIFDTGSGRQFQDFPVHVHNIFGTAERPYIWPEPKLIMAASQLQITLINNTLVAATVYVALGGFKVFYRNQFSREMLGTI